MPSPILTWLRRPFRPSRANACTARRRTLNLERLESRDVPAGTWTALTNLVPDPNGAQSMILLSDGTVMIHGGADSTSTSWYKLTPNASGSYINGTFSTLASSTIDPLFFTSDLLPNGDVFVLGGEYSGTRNQNNFTNKGAIYDPVANTWTAITNFPQTDFGDDPSEVLANGTVLAGYILGPQTYIWTPTAGTTAPGTWVASGNKLVPTVERSDEETWVKLPDGSILSYDVFNDVQNGASTSQRYVQSTGTWISSGTVPASLTSSADGYELGPGLLLPPMNGATQGNVFLTGANGNNALYTPPPAGSMATGSWVATPTIPATPNGKVADDDPGAVLPNGHVLYLADTSESNAPTQIFDYDPVANTITQQTTANTTMPSALLSSIGSIGAYVDYMVDLPNGDVLMSTSSRQLWEYTPTGSPNAAWAPTISSIAFNSGLTYTLTGTQLNGMDEGASYGDDAEMASNYPIVRLTNGSNVYYARTFNWSSTGVQTGSTPVTTQFTLPANLPFATYTVSVIANGIASTTPMTLTPPVYADTHWVGLANNTPITDADPLLAGNQPAIIGTNAFATVDAAIAAEPAGGVVIVNGDNGSSMFGNFTETVNVSKQLELYLQEGPVEFGSLAGNVAAANVVLNGVTLGVGSNTTSTEYDGIISGTGGLTMAGSGTFTLTAANTYTGATAVNAGGLLVSGTLSSASAVSVAGGATLSGTGTVGATTVSGILAPGNIVGVLTTGSLTINSSGTFSEQIMGPTAGTNYSEAVANGPINVTGATLSVTVAGGFNPAPGTMFDILVNHSGSAIVGTFNNLAEGATVTATTGQLFTISYVGNSTGGTGNDIVLTAAGPPPTVAGVVVGDGTAERSEVRSITVTFSSVVTFAGGNVAAAFQLLHLTDSTDVALTAVADNSTGETVVTLTFTGSETDAVSGENGGQLSLADGLYQLTIFSTSVTGAGNQALAGGGPNGNYVSPTDTQGGGAGELGLFRLFGDADGSGVVDQLDLADFRSAFNASTGNPLYVAYLDSDNSGVVDQFDLAQFRERFNEGVF